MSARSLHPDFEWEIIYDMSYGSRRSFSNLDGHYWQAPRVGVEAVLQKSDRAGISALHSPDGWWFWKDGRWFPTTREGKDDYRRTHIHPEVCILEGRWLTDPEWDQITRVIADRKSAWYQWERRPSWAPREEAHGRGGVNG